jgi:DNA (cytosine-5)-methyltransferase 1
MDHAHALLERMRLDVSRVFDSLLVRPLRVLDLFSGIGGFSLGFERAGMQTAGFCEIDPYCRQVLAKHWPGVPCHDDVKTLDVRSGIDVVCGGFPCQDISVAGRNAGIDGPRSGLWRDMLRIVRQVAPQWVVIENVPALRARGLDQVLGTLAALGYDAEWHCIPAAAIGAPHRRDRVWVVAHADSGGWREQGHERGAAGRAAARQPVNGGTGLAHAHDTRLEGWRQPLLSQRALECVAGQGSALWLGGARNRFEPGMGRVDDGLSEGLDRNCRPAEYWEQDTPRTVAKGLPERRRRLIALGNAIVPQIAELIGRAIVEKHAFSWKEYQ